MRARGLGVAAASSHVRMADVRDVLRSATELLENDFVVRHVTLQCEPAGLRGSEPEL